MTCEYLSEDILQANFFKCTSPVYYAQLLCGTNRVDIRDNFATPVTKGQKLYSLLIILGVTLSYSYFAFNYYELYSVTSPTILYMSIVGMVLHYTTYLLNQCFLRLTKQTDNIRLVVLLNKIDCLLNINHESDINNLQYYWSATAVFLTALVFFFGYGVHVVGTVPQYPVFTCFISIQLYSYLLEIICIGAYVYYVAVRMRLCSYLIRSMVSKLLSKYDCGDAVEVSYRVELRNVTVCLSYILEAFRTIEKIFRYSIFSILSLNFVWTFLVLIAMTEGVRKQIFPVMGLITLGLLVILYLIEIISLTFVCYKFTNEVNKLKHFCVKLLRSTDLNGQMRTVLKQMTNMIEWEKPEFSIYGVFKLDLSLTLKLISIVAYYFIVFMQITMEL